MTRTILIHLNVEVPDHDPRDEDEIAEAVLAALVVGSDDESVCDLAIRDSLHEEIEARP
jgi:hypothetical protein